MDEENVGSGVLVEVICWLTDDNEAFPPLST